MHLQNYISSNQEMERAFNFDVFIHESMHMERCGHAQHWPRSEHCSSQSSLFGFHSNLEPRSPTAKRQTEWDLVTRLVFTLHYKTLASSRFCCLFPGLPARWSMRGEFMRYLCVMPAAFVSWTMLEWGSDSVIQFRGDQRLLGTTGLFLTSYLKLTDW